MQNHDDDEKLEVVGHLAEAMRDAICDVAMGHPRAFVALAATMACAAIVQSCCKLGFESDALRASAAHLQYMADAKRKVQ